MCMRLDLEMGAKKCVTLTHTKKKNIVSDDLRVWIKNFEYSQFVNRLRRLVREIKFRICRIEDRL